jgi:hypothetical protein
VRDRQTCTITYSDLILTSVLLRGYVQILQVAGKVVCCTSIRVLVFFWRKSRGRVIGLSRLVLGRGRSSKCRVRTLIASGGSVPNFATELVDGPRRLA